MDPAYSKVHAFWYTCGPLLQSQNGPDTFKYEFVQTMGQLHPYILAVIDKPIRGPESDPVVLDALHRKVQDILGLQKRHMIQFEPCLDLFNGYLTALGLLDVILTYRLYS
jgi:hypothetical protein